MKSAMQLWTSSVHKDLPWWHRLAAAAIAVLLLFIPAVSAAFARLLISGT